MCLKELSKIAQSGNTDRLTYSLLKTVVQNSPKYLEFYANKSEMIKRDWVWQV